MVVFVDLPNNTVGMVNDRSLLSSRREHLTFHSQRFIQQLAVFNRFVELITVCEEFPWCALIDPDPSSSGQVTILKILRSG